MVALLCGAPLGTARAQSSSAHQGPQGSNYLAAHQIQTGDNAAIGIIEHPITTNVQQIYTGLIGAAHHLGTRLKGDWNFINQVPPAPPPPPLTPPNSPAPPSPITSGTSEHATLVANLAAGGTSGGYVGVAPGARVFSASIDPTAKPVKGYDTSRSAIDWIWTWAPNLDPGAPVPPKVFNLSYGYPNRDDDIRAAAQALEQFPLFLDWMCKFRGVLFVVASGNQDSNVVRIPGGHLNGITVGATDSSMQRRLAGGYIPTSPHILAPGQGVGDGEHTNTGSSFAAPQVAGAAALLHSHGLGVLGPGFPYAAKAIILNAARKRHIAGSNSANSTSLDLSVTFNGDSDYLDGAVLRNGASGSSPTTDAWTPEAWEKPAGAPLIVTHPLDDEQGVGLLDVGRALIQMNGQGTSGFAPPGTIDSLGWSVAEVSSAAPKQTYTFNVSVLPGVFLTATLCWNRRVTEQDAAYVPPAGSNWPPPSAPFQVDRKDIYTVSDTLNPPPPMPPPHLKNLDLKIYRVGGPAPVLVASSQSTEENVEHLHIPLTTAGQYAIEVSMVDPDVEGAHFALAWWLDAGELAGGAAPPPGDLDADGRVTPSDLAMLLRHLAGGSPAGDVNRDGVADARDVAALRAIAGH